jgi:LysM repeat protein
METLRNKNYASFDYISRYSNAPYYYDTLTDKQIFGIGTNLKDNAEFVTHVVKSNDTLNSLALKYYNNPTYYWIIFSFNHITDPFEDPGPGSILKIPSFSNIEFSELL